MPDGGLSSYVNDQSGKLRWTDMFVQEFVPFIDATYRTRVKAEYRAIAGLPMGGYGATIMALKHPRLFSGFAALSAAYWTDEEIETRGDTYKRPWWP